MGRVSRLVMRPYLHRARRGSGRGSHYAAHGNPLQPLPGNALLPGARSDYVDRLQGSVLCLMHASFKLALRRGLPPVRIAAQSCHSSLPWCGAAVRCALTNPRRAAYFFASSSTSSSTSSLLQALLHFLKRFFTSTSSSQPHLLPVRWCKYCL